MSSIFGRSFRFLVPILLTAAIVSPRPVLAQSSGLIPLRVADTPVAPWVLAWIAKDKGYFEERGLDVRFTEIQNLSLLPGIVGSQFDIASSTPPDLIKSALAGLDVVAVAGVTVETAANQGTKLIVRGDSGIKSITDLKGKTIAAPTLGAVNHVSTLYWLKQSGVDPNSVHGVEVAFPNMADMLKSGRVDAAESVEPFNQVMLAAGGASLGDPLLAVSDPARSTLWIAQGAWARANRPVIAKWIAALGEARDFYAQSPGDMRSILAKYTRLPDAIVQKITLPDQEPRITAKELDVWVKVLTELDVISDHIDATRLIVTAD
jgi:NitT/TauT family transport system substrate-binding protein